MVSVHHCEPISRGVLEDIVQGRHDRSGMDLHFEQPRSVPPLLRRRLERARSANVRQALLRNYFFDRLYAESGANIVLALVRWLRAASIDANQVTIRGEAPLSFRFLESLDLAQMFSLHAFLLHHSLTLQEHSQILGRTSPTVMESLLNMHLITPVGLGPDIPSEGVDYIEPDKRYRLHPLVIHPVSLRLREQNILHCE